MNKNIAVFAFVMLTLGAVATYSAPQVLADWLIDRSGTLIQVDGAILGDDDDQDGVEQQQETESKNESESSQVSDSTDTSRSGGENRRVEQQREIQKQNLEKSREALKQQTERRVKIQETSGNKSNFELKTEDGKFKLEQEIKDNQGKLLQKKEIELQDGESLHVEQEGQDTIRVDARKDGRLEMVRNRIKTHSEFDLKVGEKNDISVTLPNGNIREVALPDKALERLISNGVITQTEGAEGNSYELTAGKNGELVYKAEGQVEKKLFGLFKMKFAHNIEVAAGSSEDGIMQAGDILESESRETSPWRRLMERLSR